MHAPLTEPATDDLRERTERILALLPQTQCTRCGYDGCRPYAEAIARDAAPINRCPPGGRAGIETLARALDRPLLPLDPACGVEAPRRVAFIVESLCIGCTKCIQACPVDAIVGAAKRMHTVIADECTGCDLCVAPCPVDCIEMRETLPDGGEVPAWSAQDAILARARYEQRLERLARERAANDLRVTGKALDALAEVDDRLPNAPLADDARRRATIVAAIERARARAAARKTT